MDTHLTIHMTPGHLLNLFMCFLWPHPTDISVTAPSTMYVSTQNWKKS